MKCQQWYCRTNANFKPSRNERTHYYTPGNAHALFWYFVSIGGGNRLQADNLCAICTFAT